MSTRKKKARAIIPAPLAAKALFLSDRTCCVCRVKGKSVQVHHLDEDPSNNRIENFAVLCLECHTETQLSGGFRRKLDAEQVILYRNDWFVLVARERAANPGRLPDTNPLSDAIGLELATSIAEIYREREEYELLAFHYIEVGNNELRDKYIELAVEQGIEDEALISLRAAQGKLDLVPKRVIRRRIKELETDNSFFSLGRLYRDTEEYEKAVRATCEGAKLALEEGNVFTAAFHLKEMIEDGALQGLFVIAMERAREEKDLWWEYRTLQELEWDSEATEFLLKHSKRIEKTGEPHFLEVLAVAVGDNERYLQLRKQEAQSISAKPEPDTDNK